MTEVEGSRREEPAKDEQPISADSPSAKSEPRNRRARGKKRRSKAPSKAAKAKSRASAWAGIALAVFALVGAAIAITLFVFSRRKGPGEGQHFVVVVPKGASTKQIAHLLAEAGAVGNEQLMAVYLALSAHGDPVPGEHLLIGGSTPGELADCLSRANTRKSAKLVVPEGFNRFSIADRVEAQGIATRGSFLDATTDPLFLEDLDVPAPAGRGPESAEGYLFPATYEFKVDTSARDVVERLVRESNVRWRRIEADHAAAVKRLSEKFGWGRAEIVTLAAMVEKEAAVDEERAVIAGVFQNRLAFEDFKPKLLQSDPTSAYGCLTAPSDAPSCEGFDGHKITPKMNRDRLNRYSTYTHEGLPPGPIANPGERSIKAVLEPTESRYLFFVANGAGKHRFSESLEEHNDAIKKTPDSPPAK